MFPGICRPGVIARFTGRRCCVEAPQFFPGLTIECGDPAIRALFIGCRPQDDFVFYNQGSDIQLISLLPHGNRGIPEGLSIFDIDGNQMTVQRRPE